MYFSAGADSAPTVPDFLPFYPFCEQSPLVPIPFLFVGRGALSQGHRGSRGAGSLAGDGKWQVNTRRGPESAPGLGDFQDKQDSQNHTASQIWASLLCLETGGMFNFHLNSRARR